MDLGPLEIIRVVALGAYTIYGVGLTSHQPPGLFVYTYQLVKLKIPDQTSHSRP